MLSNLKHIKSLLYLIILHSLFPQSKSILSFTYPQSTTLSSGDIIVVEKDGIYKCDPTFNTKKNIVHTFDDEDQIDSESKLAKTIIKKSSLMILVLSNYKIYIINISTGALLYNSPNKLITDENIDYVTLAYYTSGSQLYFIIGYIDEYNNLKIQLYKVKDGYNNIYTLNPLSLSSVTRDIASESKELTFQNKGLSCDLLKDTSSDSISYFTCFIIGNADSNDYLIPLTFEDKNDALSFVSDKYTMNYINVNNCKQIKSDSEGLMHKSYVCYVTSENIGSCITFSLSTSGFFSKTYTGSFAQDSKIVHDKNCRADIYGMKVTYIFESGEVLFSCSDTDGSLLVYNFDESDGKYIKYTNCSSIYGYSIIGLYDTTNDPYYHITSDVVCPEGKIPFAPLIESSDYSPEIVTIIYTTNKVISEDNNIKSTTIISSINNRISSTINEEIRSTIRNEIKSTINNEIKSTINDEISSTINNEMKSTIMTPKIIESTHNENDVIGSTNKITEKITEINPESTIVTEKITEAKSMTSTQTIVNLEKETTIKNIMTTENIKTTQLKNTDYYDLTEKINENDCPETCLECNSEKKCTKCNKDKNYYPIEIASQESSSSQIVECITEEIKEIKYPNLYLDPESESFKPCFENCDTCYGKGDGTNNNCKTCAPDYILHPEYNNSKECVPKPNSLYYMRYGQYIVTNSDRCPEDYNLLIEEKGKCIEDCKKDSNYKYTYDGLCYESPPENTNDEDGDFICKDNPNKCIITKKVLYTLNDTITDQEIEILTFKYSKEYDYTNNHISIYENNIYIITIYKNGQCISDLEILSKTIDFGTCYTDIKTKYQIAENTNLIVVNIETKPGKEKYKKIPSYALYHPVSGTTFNLETECKNQKVIIQNNLTEEFNTSKVSLTDIKLMDEHGLNLFDPSCPFYNDLCTHYPDILNKDIPLKKRALAYYPDIKLCDDYCDLTHVFLNNLTAKCECSISGEGNQKDKLKENSIYKNKLGDLEEFIYLTNINVIKCYKDLFKNEYFIKNYGGFIILGLIFIQIICTLVYCTRSRFHLKKYIFSITNNFLNYLKAKYPYNNVNQKPSMIKDTIDKINFPPRKINKAKTGNIRKQNNANLIPKNINFKNNKKIIPFNSHNDTKEKIIINRSSNKRLISKSKTFKKVPIYNINNPKLSFEQSVSDDLIANIYDEFDINIEEFLKTDPEDMDYDDAIRKDKRTFCKYYSDKIQSEQILLNTFCYKEYLRPRPIKIMLFILQIELYFFINGLFYNEEYVTKIFELEKDTFLDQAWRFLDNLFYAFLVGVIINYVIEFFFIKEKKLRVTLKREKNNLLILKYEMVK